MLVQRSQFESALKRFEKPGTYALDTETTGLHPYQGDRLFSIILGDADGECYFNFQSYPGLADHWTLPREWLSRFAEMFRTCETTWLLSNGKFDLGFLAVENLTVLGKIHCTEAIGRVERNNRFRYGIDHLAKEIGESKSDAVRDYIKKHKLYRVELDEEGEEVKIPEFHRVPLEIIHPYGEQDARITRKVAMRQVARLSELCAQTPAGRATPGNIARNEARLTRTCFNMERTGIKLNRAYTLEAAAYERGEVKKALGEFKRATGLEFVDSGKVLAEAFTRLGVKYPTTEKGNPSFKADVLEGFNNEAARLVLNYRHAAKRLNTYYLNFLKYADSDDVIHAVIRQGGTETGRFSYADPNLQNLPKRKETKGGPFNVRRCFVPRPGFYFAMLDYDQMEYRMLLDYAGQMDVIAAVKGGLDVHEATAKMMGVEREPAKTLNFMLLYGGGVAKLCAALFKPELPVELLKELVRINLWNKGPENQKRYDYLMQGVSHATLDADIAKLRQALQLKEQYFAKLPRVKEFVDTVVKVAKTRGFVRNWAGRICNFSNPDFAYAAPNHIIQGGGADAIKFSMNEVDELLKGKKSRIVVQVHDELGLEVHESESGIEQEVKAIMEKAYPSKHLPLTVGVEYSRESWADKVEAL